MVRRITDEVSAQVAAVAAGRKPLFHDSFGDSAPQIASALRRSLPASVQVQSSSGDIFVYRPDVVGKLASPGRPLWEEVQAHATDGRWLGYGVQFPGEASVRVNIVDAAGEVASGFRAPTDNPEAFARERTNDFTFATNQVHSWVIIPD